MSARINYNRITGSNIQGDATTVTEPLGTLVVTNNGDLRLHDGTTAGGNLVGGGNANTGNFSFSDDTISNDNGLLLATDRGTLAIGTNMETPGVAGHFHIGFNGSNGNPPSSDLFLGDDYNYVKLPGYELNPADYGVEIGTHDRDGGSSNTWRFGTDGTLTFPNGAGFGLGEIGQLKVNDSTTLKLDIRDNGGRGFYTNEYGVTIRSDGDHNFTFGTDGSLTVPGDIKSVAGTGDVVIHANNGTQRTWTFGGAGSLTFPDATVQTTAYRVMSLPPLTAWGTVVSFDNLSFSFDATTGSPGFNGGYGQGSGSYSTLIWTADLYQQQLVSTPNSTISSGGPVQYFNYNGPNLITEVALTPGDSFVLRIQDVDTNRVYRATFLASFKAADAGNEGKYGAITVERLV